MSQVFVLSDRTYLGYILPNADNEDSVLDIVSKCQVN